MAFIKYAKRQDLEVIALQIDLEVMRFCKRNLVYINAVEIHSICFNDYFILKELAGMTDTPVILSIGERTLDEIDYALTSLASTKNRALMIWISNLSQKDREHKSLQNKKI